MTIPETIKGIAELWKLRSVFDDKKALLDTCIQECRITMGHDGSMVGHFPKWTCVIDENGYTYETVNRAGDTMTKHRPEHQMLVESRSKYLVVLKELGMTPAARKRIEVDVEIDDELEQLLTFKDA